MLCRKVFLLRVLFLFQFLFLSLILFATQFFIFCDSFFLLLKLFCFSFLFLVSSHFSLLLNFFCFKCCSLFLFKALKVILVLILFFYCYSTFLNITHAFILPVVCCISFAGHFPLTFISDINVRKYRWLQKKQLIFNILLQVPCLHEIWRL